MTRIHQLPPDVVTKIAAGEVIERPASVVKELLENSLDAGATRVDIELEQGGIELIRIVDNGHGIAAEDLALAFAPHATSKLRTADDLFRITTKGFRGEALASVGGVAKVTLQSRPPDAPTGAELQCDGGTLSTVRPWGGAVGTRLEVRHLLYSVPARKKFLKSPATEFGRITDVIEWVALSHPGLHLTVRHNGKLVTEIPGTAGFTDRVAKFFGADIRDALYMVDSGPGLVRVSGWVGDPATDRGNSKLQYLFVNGRWFRDRTLSYAIQEAYRGLLMTGRYAVAFLFLELPPDAVDVNAHPAKAEVRFRDQSALFSLIRSTIKARLLKENLLPKLEVPAELPVASVGAADESEAAEPVVAEPSRIPVQPPERDLFTPTRRPPPRDWDDVPAMPLRRYDPPPPVVVSTPQLPTTDIPLTVPSEPPQAPVPAPIDLPVIPDRSVLQVHDSYLVLETADGMLVIDQHALHERILYEQLRRRIKSGKLEVQRLLIPEPIDLPANQVAAVLDATDALAELGLEVAEFGGNTIVLSSYPTLLGRKAPHEILKSVVDHLVTQDRPPPKDVLLDHLMATMACKAAVKAGDKLTPDEIAYLLQLRTLAEDSHHCPHGRPTSLLFSRQELDKQFRRI